MSRTLHISALIGLTSVILLIAAPAPAAAQRGYRPAYAGGNTGNIGARTGYYRPAHRPYYSNPYGRAYRAPHSPYYSSPYGARFRARPVPEDDPVYEERNDPRVQPRLIIPPSAGSSIPGASTAVEGP